MRDYLEEQTGEAGLAGRLEHGYDQGAAVAVILRDAGFGDLASIPDLAGIPRVAGGTLPA